MSGSTLIWTSSSSSLSSATLFLRAWIFFWISRKFWGLKREKLESGAANDAPLLVPGNWSSRFAFIRCRKSLEKSLRSSSWSKPADSSSSSSGLTWSFFGFAGFRSLTFSLVDGGSCFIDLACSLSSFCCCLIWKKIFRWILKLIFYLIRSLFKNITKIHCSILVWK